MPVYWEDLRLVIISVRFAKSSLTKGSVHIIPETRNYDQKPKPKPTKKSGKFINVCLFNFQCHTLKLNNKNKSDEIQLEICRERKQNKYMFLIKP